MCPSDPRFRLPAPVFLTEMTEMTERPFKCYVRAPRGLNGNFVSSVISVSRCGSPHPQPPQRRARQVARVLPENVAERAQTSSPRPPFQLPLPTLSN